MRTTMLALFGLLIALPAGAQQKKETRLDSLHRAHHGADTTFAAMQARGLAAMGVDQYTSTHTFDVYEDGGRIALQRNEEDEAGTEAIRAHLREIEKAFREGDFEKPFFVHAGEVPGTKVMAAKKDAITYTYRPLPRGGEVRLVTEDAEAREAIRAFIRFQREAHRAEGRG